MPQGNENPSNGGTDGADLRNQSFHEEILAGKDLSVNEEVDARKQREELNGMPEFQGEEDQADDEVTLLDLGEPSPEVTEYAKRELGETEEGKCRTLQELRDMIYGN